jgi:hypothetical protein
MAEGEELGSNLLHAGAPAAFGEAGHARPMTALGRGCTSLLGIVATLLV